MKRYRINESIYLRGFQRVEFEDSEGEGEEVTNFDKWKAMTIQEAADTLTRMPHCLGENCKEDKFCSDCAKEWLEREVEE